MFLLNLEYLSAYENNRRSRAKTVQEIANVIAFVGQVKAIHETNKSHWTRSRHPQASTTTITKTMDEDDNDNNDNKDNNGNNKDNDGNNKDNEDNNGGKKDNEGNNKDNDDNDNNNDNNDKQPPQATNWCHI